MDEPAFYNHSGHHAQVLPILDRDGAEARLVLIKASYDILPGQGLRPAEAPREIRLGDEPWGDPAVADLRLPADYGLPKPGTDFVLSGHAVPPSGSTATQMDVGIRVRDRIKLLRVHGPRVWTRHFGSIGPGDSGPLERTPLAWSRAYGGADFSDPARPLEDARNPVGSGVSRHPETLVGRPAPQIEAPGEPVTATGGRHVPAGCAPIGRHFAPRRAAAGTHDAAWMADGYPARPADYRPEHEHCAAPGLVFEEPLRGGEPVRIAGVHADAVLDFVLPKRLLRVDALIDGQADTRRPHLDTVLVDSDALMLEMVWRTVFRCPSKMRRRFTSITVSAKEFIE
ncbi:DUF2169 family type VI secretion system accessory protein [Roseateles chitosanitabidus]|uniref:DUF2169 family type VI secretion system accessory protein n=1 Tax=Roseateles chitosanitabidus TaxID=65048 RepID=UPI0008359399|nr:DUF2169 domain-containing protein [Roseateles chitosanitabidus]